MYIYVYIHFGLIYTKGGGGFNIRGRGVLILGVIQACVVPSSRGAGRWLLRKLRGARLGKGFGFRDQVHP